MGNEDQASGEDEEEHEVDRHLRDKSGASLTPRVLVQVVVLAVVRLRVEVENKGEE